MHPSAKDTMVASGSSVINVGCGIYVNSNNSAALHSSGSACLSATAIDVIGGVNEGSSCPFTPAPNAYSGTTKSDPLASLTPPVYGGCDHVSFKLDKVAGTLNPGVYCGGITVLGTAGSATMNAGNYIIVGGGLTVSGGADIQGSGVFIYNTYDAKYNYGNIDISGGGNLDLEAANSGDYAGILIFEDRAAPTQNHRITGNSTSIVQGSLYFPTGNLQFSGSSVFTKFTIIVAQKISFTGHARVSSDYSGLASGSPLREGAGIVE